MKNAKSYILIGVLVIVLGVAAYLNFSMGTKSLEASKDLESAESQINGGTELPVIANGDYAVNYKEQREIKRQEEVAYLDSIIDNELTDKETLADAQSQKVEIVRSMEKELTVEGLLGAKGFENSIVTVHTGSVNVVIRSKEIDEAQAAQILDIVQKETGESAKNIKIILQG